MKLRLLALPLLLVGCGGATQQRYQAQSIRLQQVEARAGELEGLLLTQKTAGAATQAELDRCRSASRAAEAAVRESALIITDVKKRLEECERREEAVRADLDLSRRSAGAGEVELNRIRAEFERERNDWLEQEKGMVGALERTRSDNADFQSQIHVLLEEKSKIEREKREKLDEISNTYEGLLQGMRKQVAEGRVTISNLRGQLSVKLQEEILFDSGSAVVKPEGRQLLGEIGNVLSEIGDRGVLVEGHTDNLPIRGELAERFPTNWELSAARAISVVRYLQETAGVEPSLLAAAGYGEYRPAVPNDSRENRARNRRIELKLVPREASELEDEAPQHGEAQQPAPARDGATAPQEPPSAGQPLKP